VELRGLPDRCMGSPRPPPQGWTLSRAHYRRAMAAYPSMGDTPGSRQAFGKAVRMQQQQSWQSTVIGLGFIAFAGFALWVAADHNFSAIWAGVGTIIGVVTGAIPSYFFKQQSDKATAKSDKATAKVTALAGIADPAAYRTLMDDHPELAP
jgi:hypothetical protein